MDQPTILPRSLLLGSDEITRAAAPSLMDEALAAVMVPSFLNTDRSVGSLSKLTWAGDSSVSMVTVPFLVLCVTGAISDLKSPLLIAACARW